MWGRRWPGSVGRPRRHPVTCGAPSPAAASWRCRRGWQRASAASADGRSPRTDPLASLDDECSRTRLRQHSTTQLTAILVLLVRCFVSCSTADRSRWCAQLAHSQCHRDIEGLVSPLRVTLYITRVGSFTSPGTDTR